MNAAIRERLAAASLARCSAVSGDGDFRSKVDCFWAKEVLIFTGAADHVTTSRGATEDRSHLLCDGRPVKQEGGGGPPVHLLQTGYIGDRQHQRVSAEVPQRANCQIGFKFLSGDRKPWCNRQALCEPSADGPVSQQSAGLFRKERLPGYRILEATEEFECGPIARRIRWEPELPAKERARSRRAG